MLRQTQHDYFKRNLGYPKPPLSIPTARARDWVSRFAAAHHILPAGPPVEAGAGCITRPLPTPLVMREPSAARADFINQVLTSSFPGQVAKRFAFPDGEVGVLYTMGLDQASGQACPVVLYVATFPPSPQQGGRHDFGIDFWEQPVGSAAEAAQLIAQFQRTEAQMFRASCRA